MRRPGDGRRVRRAAARTPTRSDALVERDPAARHRADPEPARGAGARSARARRGRRRGRRRELARAVLRARPGGGRAHRRPSRASAVDLFSLDGERTRRDRGPAPSRRRRARLGLHAFLGARRARWRSGATAREAARSARALRGARRSAPGAARARRGGAGARRWLDLACHGARAGGRRGPVCHNRRHREAAAHEARPRRDRARRGRRRGARAGARADRGVPPPSSTPGMWAAVPTSTPGGAREAELVKDFDEVPRDAERVIFFPRAAGGAPERPSAWGSRSARPRSSSSCCCGSSRDRASTAGSRRARRARPSGARAAADDGYDPGRERRAEQRARELLRSCVNERGAGRCTATSGSSACGRARPGARRRGHARAVRLPDLPAQADRRLRARRPASC